MARALKLNDPHNELMSDTPITPRFDRRDDGADDGTDDWLAALAGRPRAGAAPGVNAEATLLRDASRRWPAAVPVLSAEQIEAQLTALLAAAHADPALASKRRSCATCAAVRRWLSRPSRWAGAVAIATVAVLAVVVLPWQQMSPPRPGAATDETLRGSTADGVQRLRATDPQALRDRIADELARAGVPVTRYERLGRYGLDADLPAPPPDAVLQLLRGHGLAVPVGGGLAVEVEGVPR